MLLRVSISLALIALLTGCQTQREVFAGHDPDEVWTAMLAAARTPDYSSGDYSDQWTVRDNNVWIDEQAGRIEIARRLERSLHRPAAPVLHEERHWKLSVQLESRDPPTVAFTARNIGVPAHAWDEADRYFSEVREVLESQPGAPAPTPALQPNQLERHNGDGRPAAQSPPPMDEPH